MEEKQRNKNKKNRWADWERGLKLRTYFTNMFGDNTPEGERRVAIFCKKVLFIVVLVVELLLLSQHVEIWVAEGEWLTFLIASAAAIVLAVTETLSLFVLKEERHRLPLYIVQVISVYGFVALTKGSYSLLLYIVILSQLYLDVPSGSAATGTLIGSMLLYVASYGLQIYLSFSGSINLFDILRELLGALALLALHFLVVQFLVTFYRQYLKLNRTLAELDESKKELEKAYAVVAEVSVLEERQRIAKEIHDTAGHSLTTVSMQTESAKRVVETHPEEAKMKIIAANLQAKTTLERLRESVHLLSGSTEGMTLKTALEGIIHESTDGTGVRIRSEIADMVMSSSKSRFLCNALREGISNGLRHGNATAFWFELKESDGKIAFLLSDNGKGLQDKQWKKGFGLTSLQDRAKSFGGEVEFVSDPDEGFEIRITIPMDVEA